MKFRLRRAALLCVCARAQAQILIDHSDGAIGLPSIVAAFSERIFSLNASLMWCS